ncbi:MAG: S41 family peptidase [Pseudomonadota bacterium]
MTSRFARSLLALAMTLALAPAVRADAPATSAATAPVDIRAKETFAVVWERLQNSGFKGQHEGLDWAALKAEHQPAIEGAKDLASLRNRINALLKDLRASHLSLIPAEAMPPPNKTVDIGMAEVGLRLAIVDGKLLVEHVIDGFPAARAGIRPGWQVERIDDFDAAKTLTALDQASPDAARRGASMLQLRSNDLVDQLPSDKAVNLQLRDLDGATRTVSLTAMANPHVQAITLLGLPPMPLRFTQRTLPARDGGCVLYVEFSQWAMPVYDRFVEALREHGGCSGVVIDLRGNSGGMMATMSAVGGLFFEETVSLGTLSTGGGNLQLTAFPRQVTDDGRDVRRFRGPLAILTDRASISCSDIFPASMQALERARIFGDTSAGMALPATTVPLPSGDRLYYPIADFSDPKGRRIEGVGVIPDTPSAPTVDALRAGRDRTLDAALAWIGEAGKQR